MASKAEQEAAKAAQDAINARKATLAAKLERKQSGNGVFKAHAENLISGWESADLDALEAMYAALETARKDGAVAAGFADNQSGVFSQALTRAGKLLAQRLGEI